jgi:hypothetical protein
MRYRRLHPEVAEVLATDKQGSLVAATGKSSDYDQSDERWWQDGARLSKGNEFTDELGFDESSGVFSLDVIVPRHHGEEFAGVAKLSVDLTSLSRRVAFDEDRMAERCEILLPDGRILASSKRGFKSLAKSLPKPNLETIRRDVNGWTITTAQDGQAWMTEFVALKSVSHILVDTSCFHHLVTRSLPR